MKPFSKHINKTPPKKLATRMGIYLPNTRAVSAVVPEELLTPQSSAKARSAMRNPFRREFSTSSKNSSLTSEACGKLASSKNNLIAFFLTKAAASAPP